MCIRKRQEHHNLTRLVVLFEGELGTILEEDGTQTCVFLKFTSPEISDLCYTDLYLLSCLLIPLLKGEMSMHFLKI